MLCDCPGRLSNFDRARYSSHWQWRDVQQSTALAFVLAWKVGRGGWWPLAACSFLIHTWKSYNFCMSVNKPSAVVFALLVPSYRQWEYQTCTNQAVRTQLIYGLVTNCTFLQVYSTTPVSHMNKTVKKTWSFFFIFVVLIQFWTQILSLSRRWVLPQRVTGK